MLKTLIEAFALISTWEVIIAMFAASVYGLVIGSLPGLSATMATALLVPVTFYLSPIAAIATIVAASSMAIFSGDIPGALLRIPGTPASAAYADEAYAMTRKGQAELALGAGVWFSAVGGIAGVLSLMILAPPLAEIALSFSTFEYFWLALLGLMCATLVARSSPVKAIAGMFLGLLVSCIGIENPGGVPRFTFGITDLFGGIEPIPALVGVFAVAQVMRAMLTPEPPPLPRRKFGSIMAGQWKLTKKYHWQMTRGNIIGIIIGVLPGAGADMAAWVSYAMSKRFSKEPEKFGTGHVEGLVEAGASNNASIASGWVPSLLFGIPGDTIAAIAIGVLYMKGLNPGPTLFTEKASSMYAIYLMFIIANILMIPLGIAMIRIAAYILLAPRSAIMPIIMLCCAVGSFAIGNNMFGVVTVAAFGVIGYVMEANGYPVAAMVLGIVMGTMVEQAFVTSLIKSGGSILPFFERPVAAILAAMAIGALLWPVLVWVWRKVKPVQTAAATTR
ncbi:putative tricarboxylic transport membrane protein [Bradyrhizobium japonicum]